MVRQRLAKVMRAFLEMQAASGVILFVFAVLALIAANSSYADTYQRLLLVNFPINLSFLSIYKDMSVKLWIDDFLMAIFFLLVGLELKRELAIGELSSKSQAVLPFFAALGGVAIPALIFFAMNIGDADSMRGVAVPTATDIAFAIGVLSLFGNKVPNSLRVFLVALAIIDDLIAILIITIFYSNDIHFQYLAYAFSTTVLLFFLNKAKVLSLTPYLLIAPLLWLFVLKSGVHATVAGVILAFFIPVSIKNNKGVSPLHSLEHKLHSPVSYFVLPIFAFANSGVDLSNFSFSIFSENLVMGIMCGLFIGKQVGVAGAVYLLNKFKICGFFKGVSWMQFYGVAVLTGIGFTMSLFIGNLAFANHSHLFNQVKIGVIAGSILSGVFGAFILWISSRNKEVTSNVK
jgi:NhaA family Na+:H+ antiporter